MIECLETELSTVNKSPELRDYVLNHTMLRTKNPRTSIEFYTSVLGMTLFKQLDFSDMEFTLYFLGYLPPGIDELPAQADERTGLTFQCSGMVELTHNWSDNILACKNVKCTKSNGFGHLGVSVPDIYAACERMDKLGVKFIKRPDEGKMVGIAFIEDPDGHQIEILQSDLVVNICKEFGAIKEGSEAV